MDDLEMSLIVDTEGVGNYVVNLIEALFIKRVL